MEVVELTKHLFGQHFCPVYEGKAKSCLQLPHDAQATDKIFGEKTVVLGGDFRQILLVVPNGG